MGQDEGRLRSVINPPGLERRSTDTTITRRYQISHISTFLTT
jgi:hypothetical protein